MYCIWCSVYNVYIYIVIHQFILMITSKLGKDQNCSSLLIQFSNEQLPLTLHSFYQNCRQEGVRLKRSAIPANHIKIYSVSTNLIEILGVTSDEACFKLVMRVIYLTKEQEVEEKNSERRLIIREGLETKFYFESDVQETMGERESLQYLCEVSSCIIRAQNEEKAGFYDQKAAEIKGDETGAKRLWQNTLFQMPGMGREKCLAVALAFPSYESVLRDYEGKQLLKHTWVERGGKQGKLGKVLAKRIYKCLISRDPDQSVFD